MIRGALSGTYHKNVRLGKRIFKLYQPNIIQIDEVGFDIKKVEGSAIDIMANITNDPVNILSYALTIKKTSFRGRVKRYITKHATWEQIKVAFIELYNIIYGVDLFKSCNLDEVTSKELDVIGGKTLAGQIPSFSEYLHISYSDIIKIPYPVLLLMVADKQRLLGEDDTVKIKVSGREMLGMKS